MNEMFIMFWFACSGYLQARAAVAEYTSTPTCKVKPEVNFNIIYNIYTNQTSCWLNEMSLFQDVIICSGCSCALDMCITALANPGQNILIPCPAFTLYETQAAGLGVNVRSYNLLVSIVLLYKFSASNGR